MSREEITAKLHKFLATYHENVECDTCLNVFEGFRNLVTEICEEEEKVIEWEQRRYEIAKSVICGVLGNQEQMYYILQETKFQENEQHTVPLAISRYAVACADALIKELKGGKE